MFALLIARRVSVDLRLVDLFRFRCSYWLIERDLARGVFPDGVRLRLVSAGTPPPASRPAPS